MVEAPQAPQGPVGELRGSRRRASRTTRRRDLGTGQGNAVREGGPGMTALEELQAANLGADFVKLLYRQVATVAKAHRFPPPGWHRDWTVDDVQETAHD